MSRFQKTLCDVSRSLGTVDPGEIELIFEKYSRIPVEAKSIIRLRSQLRLKHPILFGRDIQFSGRTISANNQEKIKLNTLKAHAEYIKGFKSLKMIEHYVEECARDAKKTKKQLELLFPKDKFSITFRIKEPSSILQNIKWGNSYTLVDVIGLRIVPKHGCLLPSALKKIERLFGAKLHFKINIFSYSSREITNKISKNSIYYRAIHYHFPVRHFFVEIQVRTPSIDLWANLNHDTLYKTKIKINDRDKLYVFRFGRVANIVDYFDILANPNISVQ